MKTTITTTLGAGLLALLAAGSAFGQQRLTADIPFEFRLADKVMPAAHFAASSARICGREGWTGSSPAWRRNLV